MLCRIEISFAFQNLQNKRINRENEKKIHRTHLLRDIFDARLFVILFGIIYKCFLSYMTLYITNFVPNYFFYSFHLDAWQ